MRTLQKVITSFSAAAIQASVLTTTFKNTGAAGQANQKVAEQQISVDKIRLSASNAEKQYIKDYAAFRRNPGGVNANGVSNAAAALASDTRSQIYQGEQARIENEFDIKKGKADKLNKFAIAGGIGLGVAGAARWIFRNPSTMRIYNLDILLVVFALAAAGGLASGASSGAVIGSLTGVPFGAAIGAVVGGLVGLATSLYDFTGKIKTLSFEKSAKEFQDVLKDVQSGVAKPAVVSGSIGAGLSAVFERIGSTTGENNTAAKGELVKALPQVLSFLDAVAKGSRTIDEFEKAVGANTLSIVSLTTGISPEKLREQYDKEIKDKAASNRITKEVNIGMSLLEQRVRAIDGLASAINEAKLSASSFNAQLEEGITGLADFTHVFDNIGNVGNQDTFNALARGAGILLGPLEAI